MASLEGLNPEILDDFITESRELLESLDVDLVALESDKTNEDLLNRIFRAIHTIKGAASFLALNPLTTVAHAAEDALNLMRNGKLAVTAEVMDPLLQAVDVIRGQVDEVSEGEMCTDGPADLIETLHRISAGGEAGEGEAPAEEAEPATEPQEADPNKLQLCESKKDLLPFMVDDLKNSLTQLSELVEQLKTSADLGNIAAQMRDITEGLVRSIDFYEIDVMCQEVGSLEYLAEHIDDLDPELLSQTLPRAAALLAVLQERTEALGEERLIDRTTETLMQRLRAVIDEHQPVGDATLEENCTTEQVLKIDGVVSDGDQEATETPADNNKTEEKDGNTKPAAKEQEVHTKSGAEQTIRVDVTRLEALLNLTGELVLQKNRVLSLTRKLRESGQDTELAEEAVQVTSDLDRVTADLQISVMKTRMQPMNKLFSRYPRVIRDLARATDKQIELEVLGGETEVDKSVLEGLADPLVHILRNSADHGVESPEVRKQNGKNPIGNITISAKHEGNNVLIQISDDGKGLDPKKIGGLAIERGLITKEDMASMTDNAIMRLIFAPGFSTAEQVSDLSGRGVGMDVVNSNITKLNGSVAVDSVPGQGTTVSIKIPLTVAIMHAMMVGVGTETYAVPLSNLLEIVRPNEEAVYTIEGSPVMRLRDTVLPLVNLGQRFGDTGEESEVPFALVVGSGKQQVGVLVERLIGQQEVVIKPLDDLFANSEHVSGATVREDGGVSLILDISSLLRDSEQVSRAAAA